MESDLRNCAMIYPGLDQLKEYVAQGFATARRHPHLPLRIYNYSVKTQYNYTAHTWPKELRDARGLILDEDGLIVARGFPKFFNLSQLPDWPSGQPEFWEKADGSLIVAFSHEGETLCATRGSFESEQAVWAATKIPVAFQPLPGISYCLEAIYPSNRIVVDYNGREELVLLAAIDQTGADRDDMLPQAEQHFRKAKFHGQLEASQLPVDQIGEGFVLRWPDGTRAKVKLDEYVRAHHLLFALSTRSIWEMLVAGEDVEARYAELPEQIRKWASERAQIYRRAQAAMVLAATAEFREAPQTSNRAEFAVWAKTRKCPGLLFKLLDGKSIEDDAWKLIEPKWERPTWIDQIEEG